MADVNWQRSLEKLLRFDNLEKRVQTHLKNVYSCLSMAMLAAAAGGYVHLYTNLMQASLLTVFASIGLILALAFTPHSPENQTKRLAYLVGFGFFSGMGLGPLMDVIIRIDPSIIPTAFLGTTLIFVSFTLSALLGNQRKWLYLGGTLFSGLSILMLLSLANLFIGSYLLFEIKLYVGLAIMCGFILYDSQLIVEKCRQGDDDYIWHSVDLFIDFIQVFRYLMVILGNKEEKKKRN